MIGDMELLHQLAILLCGYSLFSALTLALGHFQQQHYAPFQRLSGLLLLTALAGLQLSHFLYLQLGIEVIHSHLYALLLFIVAPTFYLFSKPMLLAEGDCKATGLLHFTPLLAAALLPPDQALPLAFLLGAGYLLALARLIWALRAQRRGFQQELLLLGAGFAVAVAAMLLGLNHDFMPATQFFSFYASAIGVIFLLVSIQLTRTPELPAEITEAAQRTYAISTLNNVDCQHTLQQLKHLMETEKLYQNPQLSLKKLAQQLQLNPHQLSELLNTRLGKSFSRYVREYRVAAAQQRLRDAPSRSVLSISMEVGFSSQSNFYQAFREITGMTPGKYRKLLQNDHSAKHSCS